jgi:hypothetical protein
VLVVQLLEVVLQVISVMEELPIQRLMEVCVLLDNTVMQVQEHQLSAQLVNI